MAPKKKSKGDALQSQPLLLVRDVEQARQVARQLDISESRLEYCVHCRKSFNSVNKHRKPGTTCFDLARKEEAARSARKRQSRSSNKKARKSQAASRTPTPIPQSAIPQSDDAEMVDDFKTPTNLDPNIDMGPRNEHALDAIQGKTDIFLDDEDVPVPELPPEEIPRPEGQDETFDPPDDASRHTHIVPPDQGDFLPGCTRQFDPKRRAGAPVRESPNKPPERYLTPYELWYNDWKEKHQGEDATWAPFRNELDWYLAHWLKSCRIGHAETDRLLAIPGVGSSSLIISIATFLIKSLNS